MWFGVRSGRQLIHRDDFGFESLEDVKDCGLLPVFAVPGLESLRIEMARNVRRCTPKLPLRVNDLEHGVFFRVLRGSTLEVAKAIGERRNSLCGLT